jgi:outer membrane protein
MKNPLNNFILLLCCTAVFINPALGQKAGYLNFGNIITLMPETQAADLELDQYQKELVLIGEEMVNDFQKKEEAFLKKVQEMSLTSIQLQAEEQKLAKQRQEILAYEQEITQKIEKRREALLAPIVEKATMATEIVLKKYGYEIIFDTSIFNAVLSTDESLDISDLVKAELGLR